ncbi:45122_t:CDS:1, partial [Gigaspora margarita]
MNKNNNIIEIPVNPKEEAIFRKLEDDNYEGSLLLSEKVSTLDKIKYELCRSIIRYKREKKMELSKIANELGLEENSTHRLLRYHLEGFALDSLIDYVEKLHIPLQVK